MTLRTHRSLIVAFFAYVATLLSLPSPARAEDIDIFTRNPLLSTQRPNVLFILDTSANWAATDQVAANGTNIYQNVRTELAKTIDGLQENVFRVGLMIYAETGTGNDNIDGGVARLGVRDLDSSNKSLLVEFFKTIDANFDKTNNTSMGLAFNEAYLYYTGKTAFSGGTGKVKRDHFKNNLPTSGNQQNDNPTLAQSNALWELDPNTGHAFISGSTNEYKSPISDACQKNFIIYIANGNVTDPNSANVEATSKLTTAGGDTTTIDINPDDGDQGNVSDEWARFLFDKDLLPDDAVKPVTVGKQNIITYTVEVNPQTDTQGRSNSQLLRSMAINGGGEYFGVFTKTTGTQKTLSEALNQIFAQIIDRNDVFAASTLPVSSNVRGTFLNQVYMGLFRPDPNSSPRWPGNLKKYKLNIAGGKVFLADKNGASIEATADQTGFIKPDVTSFWTVQETTGFWDPAYYPETVSLSNPTAFDAPDGAFVEKGGAAQHLRMRYAGNVNATDGTGRKIYTCISSLCSSGAVLSGSADHAFVKANAAITDLMLGITGPKTVSSLTRSGSTATAVATAHGFTQGQVVAIEGANPAAYNGFQTISVVNANTFTFPVTVTPASPATGAPIAAKAGAQIPVSSLTRTSTTATVTTTIPHGFGAPGTVTTVIISGANDTAYNTSFSATIVDANTFRFTVTETPVSPATVAGTAKVGGSTRNIKSNPTVGVTRPTGSTTVTIETTNNHGFAAGNSVTIAGVAPNEYNGVFTIVSASGKIFTYDLLASAIGPALSDTSLVIRASGATTRAISTLTRSGTTASATTTDPHGFTSPTDSITISGAAQAEYNGAFTVTITGANTFTYTVPVNPATPAAVAPPATSITATGGGGVTKDDLVDWVRGGNLQDDNPFSATSPPVKTARVRGYLHGDVLHSRPAVVNYNRSGQPQDRDIVVYYGANDGIVHAVKGGADDTDGFELWGFIPTEFYDRFSRLFNESPIISTTNRRAYLADGPVSVDTVTNNDLVDPKIQRLEGAGAKAQLFVGMRRGGRFYYSLDVTNPVSPVFKWKIDNTTSGFGELGQSWSDAKVAKINVVFPPSSPAASRKVIIFGGGYDAAANDPATQGVATMGRAIYVVDADTGALIWTTGPDNSISKPADATYIQTSGMTFAIPAALAVIDSDADVNGFADRIYAGDTGGNIWRVDIFDPDPANWNVHHVAALSGAAANQKRKFLATPDIVAFDGSWDSILIGSGDRENPFDTAISNRFYMIKDKHDLDGSGLTTVTDASDGDESGLVDLTDNLIGTDPTNPAAVADAGLLATLRGWKIRMNIGPGEKVVTGATTLAGTTIFGTSVPPQSTGGQCGGDLPKAFVYAVNFKDATPNIDWGDPAAGSAGRATQSGLGLPANPAPFVTEIGGKLEEGVIIPPTVVQPSTIKIGQRYRVFWNLSVDN